MLLLLSNIFSRSLVELVAEEDKDEEGALFLPVLMLVVFVVTPFEAAFADLAEDEGDLPSGGLPTSEGDSGAGGAAGGAEGAAGGAEGAPSSAAMMWSK